MGTDCRAARKVESSTVAAGVTSKHIQIVYVIIRIIRHWVMTKAITAWGKSRLYETFANLKGSSEVQGQLQWATKNKGKVLFFSLDEAKASSPTETSLFHYASRGDLLLCSALFSQSTHSTYKSHIMSNTGNYSCGEEVETQDVYSYCRQQSGISSFVIRVCMYLNIPKLK